MSIPGLGVGVAGGGSVLIYESGIYVPPRV